MAEDNIQFENNLENLLSPFCYVPEVPLPKTVPEIPGGMYLSGFISQDCTWGCCYNHSVLKCFPVERFFEESHVSFMSFSSNSAVAVSSNSYTFPGGHITCATELAIHNPRTQSGMRKLLLGISYTGDNNNRDLRGAVVIFDPVRCAPMKWIEVPEPVSSITVLSHFEEGGSNRPFFNETMMAMVGIAAVGLRGGSVIIIDLGLDDSNLSTVSASDCRDSSDSTYRLLYVNPHEYVIATKRHKAVSKRSLIALKFTNEPEDEMIADAFHYCRPTGESLLVLNKNSVAVTCLEYVPAIGSLLVGFTFGGFQIWRVNNMELQFTSEPMLLRGEEPLHVFGFGFQQPVDDPKNYCYIWVMYGNKSAECANAFMELHSLYYERKNSVENFGFVYDGFKQCAKRMAFPLVDDFLSDSENEDYENIKCSARPIRIWTQPDSDLMYCAWEVGRGGVFYLGAFDLNQWYSNHTKEQIFYDHMNGLCPYWVALPVDITDVSNFVMDVRLLPKSLMRWENPHAKLDLHLYPASLSFRAMVLTNTGVSGFEHFGVQEKLVRKVLRDGPSLMIQPETIRHTLMNFGMEPVFPVLFGEHLSLKNQDRFYILTVLLENRRITPIINLASAWLDGSFANVGCTIDLLIDWIGGYTVALRGAAGEHWDTLFHFPDSTLPPETVRFINFSNFAWTSLHRLLLTVMKPTEVFSMRMQELEYMEFGLGKLVQYSSALLMMHKAHLLPVCDGAVIKGLCEYYDQRRKEAKDALENCIYIDSQLKNSHPLMIDHLMDSLLEDVDLHEEWHVEEGQPCYPPRHVGYLVNMFMWLDADPKAVSRVFMYFLIDLNYVVRNSDLTQNSSSIERKVKGDFRSIMEGSADEYQEISALWLLDHRIPNEILVLLKETDRLYQKDGLPWCAAAVALTASGYENDVAELLLKSCPQNLAKLLFSLMTSSTTKFTSLAELMVSSNLSNNEELLQEFFEISEERERLAEFIRTKSKELPDQVKTALLAFLNKGNSVKRMSQLLMFYVHSEDFNGLEDEYKRVRELIRHQKLSDSDANLWKFQNTYVSHLLNTTKTSKVQQFLRLQGRRNIRNVQSTMSIKALPANEDESDFDEVSNRAQFEPKVAPHLRRLKLSESIAHDPLSPLRRYAGRIQSAVSAVATIPESMTDSDVLPKRLSMRKSFSRRISVGRSRHSILNSSRFDVTSNENIDYEDRLNTTSRNDQIDLINLLKTPSVDHRAENRLKNSFISFNQTIRKEEEDEVHNITLAESAVPHSIMKEVDPSKPKGTKKVELRFENLSLSSEEGDEKNVTIYEDADENLEECINQENLGEVVNRDNMEVVINQYNNKKSIEEGINEENLEEVVNRDNLDAVIYQDTQERDNSKESLEEGNMHENLEDGNMQENLEEGNMQENLEEGNMQETMEDVVIPHNLEVVINQDKQERDNSKESLEEGSMQENPMIDVSYSSTGADSLLTGDPTQSELRQGQTSSASSIADSVEFTNRRSIRARRSKTPTRDLELSTEDETEKSIKRSRQSSTSSSLDVSLDTTLRRSTRSTRSKTPKREPVLEVGHEDLTATTAHDVSESTRRSVRSRRSKTPSRELEIIPEDGTDKSTQKQEQASPSLDVSVDSRTRRSVRSTRSKTPTRDVDVDFLVAADPSQSELRQGQTSPASSIADSVEFNNRRSIRARRSKTPTRDLELLLEDGTEKSIKRSRQSSTSSSLDVSLDTTLRRSTRSTRSKTPTREPVLEVGHEDLTATTAHDVSESTRRSVRSRRSKTPSRELEIIPEDGTDKSTQKQEQTSPSLDVSLDTTLRRSTRSTRSKTPTREPVFEVGHEDLTSTSSLDVSESTRRIVKSRRSKTPSRDLEMHSEDGSDVFAQPLGQTSPTPSMDESRTRRSTRNTRSKTPTREMELQSVAEASKMTSRRETRSSKTPSRDMEEETQGSKTNDKMFQEPALESSQASTSASSFFFEVTQDDLREEDDEEEDDVDILVPSSSKKTTIKKVSKARTRRLKFLQHHHDLSTLIEDSGSEPSEGSVLEATIIAPAPKPDPPKNRRIKGIKARPAEEEPGPDSEPAKPTKRRKAASTIDLDEDLEVMSQASSRSTRSASSRRSVDSTKPKSTRRKARGSNKSQA